MATTAPPAGNAYPVRLDIHHADVLSRLTFAKWILAVPQYLIVGALNGVFNRHIGRRVLRNHLHRHVSAQPVRLRGQRAALAHEPVRVRDVDTR